MAQNKRTRLWRGEKADEEAADHNKDISHLVSMKGLNASSRNHRIPDALSQDQIRRPNGANRQLRKDVLTEETRDAYNEPAERAR